MMDNVNEQIIKIFRAFLFSRKNEISHVDDSVQPESDFGIKVNLKLKTEKIVARKASTSAPKISKRVCFSLVNINSTNECKVLYKNCLLCNRRKDLQTPFSNKINSLQSTCDIADKPEEIVKPRHTVEKHSSLVGFASTEFTIYKVENAITEHLLEQIFTIDESYSLSNNNLEDAIGNFIKSLTMAEEKEIDLDRAVENNGETMLHCLSLNTSFKIAVGSILSLYIIYVLYTKFSSALVIK